jgi:phosphoglycerate dehydrogenase-like enzyme
MSVCSSGACVDAPFAFDDGFHTFGLLWGGARLDVFADEPRVPQALIDMPHVVLLPHVGSASHHTRRLMGQLVVDNLVSWFKGKGPLTPVAETPWAKA